MEYVNTWGSRQSKTFSVCEDGPGPSNLSNQSMQRWCIIHPLPKTRLESRHRGRRSNHFRQKQSFDLPPTDTRKTLCHCGHHSPAFWTSDPKGNRGKWRSETRHPPFESEHKRNTISISTSRSKLRQNLDKIIRTGKFVTLTTNPNEACINYHGSKLE